ncbi:CLUMA_CG012944, isoform A [Clunio marinus]|uniref:CLUMA_CG012944, isoform A n=1 Tax=Clunio marinus TaxID=568069 RepID=A0A1J1IME0_9DIPT|nr:CLUMA_CG012944, isoform A [Clunio marinus]
MNGQNQHIPFNNQMIQSTIHHHPPVMSNHVYNGNIQQNIIPSNFIGNQNQLYAPYNHIINGQRHVYAPVNHSMENSWKNNQPRFIPPEMNRNVIYNPQSNYYINQYQNSPNRVTETPLPLPIECTLGPETPSPSLPSTSPPIDEKPFDTGELMRMTFIDEMNHEAPSTRKQSTDSVNSGSRRTRRTKAQIAADRNDQITKDSIRCRVYLEKLLVNKGLKSMRIFRGENGKYFYSSNRLPRVHRMKKVPKAFLEIVNIGYMRTQHGIIQSCLHVCRFKTYDYKIFHEHLQKHEMSNEALKEGSCNVCKQSFPEHSLMAEYKHMLVTHIMPLLRNKKDVQEILYSKIKGDLSSEDDEESEEEEESNSLDALPQNAFEALLAISGALDDDDDEDFQKSHDSNDPEFDPNEINDTDDDVSNFDDEEAELSDKEEPELTDKEETSSDDDKLDDQPLSKRSRMNDKMRKENKKSKRSKSKSKKLRKKSETKPVILPKKRRRILSDSSEGSASNQTEDSNSKKSVPKITIKNLQSNNSKKIVVNSHEKPKKRSSSDSKSNSDEKKEDDTIQEMALQSVKRKLEDKQNNNKTECLSLQKLDKTISNLSVESKDADFFESIPTPLAEKIKNQKFSEKSQDIQTKQKISQLPDTLRSMKTSFTNKSDENYEKDILKSPKKSKRDDHQDPCCSKSLDKMTDEESLFKPLKEKKTNGQIPTAKKSRNNKKKTANLRSCALETSQKVGIVVYKDSVEDTKEDSNSAESLNLDEFFNKDLDMLEIPKCFVNLEKEEVPDKNKHETILLDGSDERLSLIPVSDAIIQEPKRKLKKLCDLYPWVDDNVSKKWKKLKKTKESLLKNECMYSVYKCMSQCCSYFTIDFQAFKKHLTTHVKDDKYFLCSSCLHDEKNPADLIEHIETFHKFDCFQCNKCMYRSSEVLYVVIHQKKFHGINQKKKDTENSLVIINGYGATMDKHKTEKNAALGKLSKKIEKLMKAFKCKFCTKSFYTHELLIKHLMDESSEQKDKSEEINLEIEGIKKSISQEMSEYGTYQCLYCSDAFEKKDNIREHLSEIHPQKFFYAGERMKSNSDSSSKPIQVISVLEPGELNHCKVEKWRKDLKLLTNDEFEDIKPISTLKIENCYTISSNLKKS